MWERCGIKQKHLETGERRSASGRQRRSHHWNSNCCLTSRGSSDKVRWWQVQSKYMEVISHTSYSSPCKHLSIRWCKCWKFLWFKGRLDNCGGKKINELRIIKYQVTTSGSGVSKVISCGTLREKLGKQYIVAINSSLQAYMWNQEFIISRANVLTVYL